MRLFASPIWIRFVLALSLLLAAGCAEEAPSPSSVEDLRVLAVRAEPPELLFDRAGGDAQPVTFEALVVDPRGLATNYDWRFCPVESSQTCADYADRAASVPAEVRPLLDAARAQATQGPAALAPDRIGAMGIGPFTVSVSPALFAAQATSAPLALGDGAWLSAALTVGNGSETLPAEKRVVVGARDLAEWNPELAAQGWQICPPAPAPPPAGCLPLAPRAANHNPEVTGVEVARGALAGAPFEPLTGTLTLAPKQTVRLRPVLGGGASERYQTIEATFQGDRLTVVDHQEDPVVSWFATAGKFSDAQTTAKLTKTLDDAFTAPDVAPPATGGKLSVFLVVRDQRGGTGWARVDVLIAL